MLEDSIIQNSKSALKQESKDEASEELLEQDEMCPPSKLTRTSLPELILFPFFVLFFLLVLVVFEVVQRIAHPFGMSALEKAVRGLNVWVVNTLWVVGAKIVIEGKRDFPTGRPYLIVSNHQSLYDITIIHRCFNALRPRFIAKKELGGKIPGVSYCLRYEGSALIDRQNKSQSVREIIKFAKRVRELKCAAIMFPEGTRARDGKLKRFHAAGFSVMAKALPEALIIPVAIDNSWKFQARKFGPVPLGEIIRLKIGKPIENQGQPAEQLLEQTFEQVKLMLNQIRSEHRPPGNRFFYLANE